MPHPFQFATPICTVLYRDKMDTMLIEFFDEFSSKGCYKLWMKVSGMFSSCYHLMSLLSSPLPLPSFASPSHSAAESSSHLCC